jgi:hypothetical protein
VIQAKWSCSDCQKQKLLPDYKNHYLAHVSEKNNYSPAAQEATTNAGAVV